MTKQSRMLPARKARDRSRDDDSLLLRSAESLGRVIGALQRQLDGATKRLSRSSGNGELRPATSRVAKRSSATTRARAAATKRKSSKSVRATVARKAKKR